MFVGILGGGQLGRMLGEAGQPLGMTFRFLDPGDPISAQAVGGQVKAGYDDPQGLEEFRQGLDVVTYEFENVPMESAALLSGHLPVYPSALPLRTAQDRLYEKNHAQTQGLKTPRFAPFFFKDEFREALDTVGLPAVMKTRRFGYDGKGQRVIRTMEEADQAFADLQGVPLILEQFISFERELSLLAVRDQKGNTAFWPLVWNQHRDGILRLSIAPAPDVSEELDKKSRDYAGKMMDSLDYTGVLAIEFFQKDGELFFNEMAPRVHNSGHWSIEGSKTSQFENHVRAVAGLPLGDTAMVGPSAMINLIGEMDPGLGEVLKIEGTFLHDYDKSPRPARKLAHLTVVADSSEGLNHQLAQINELLTVNKLTNKELPSA
jgi:5-(carboxyamino)imidazole ribonucleotide synthase